MHMFTRAQKGGHSRRKGIPPKSRSHDSLQARQVAQARWVHLAKWDSKNSIPHNIQHVPKKFLCVLDTGEIVKGVRYIWWDRSGKRPQFRADWRKGSDARSAALLENGMENGMLCFAIQLHSKSYKTFQHQHRRNYRKLSFSCYNSSCLPGPRHCRIQQDYSAGKKCLMEKNIYFFHVIFLSGAKNRLHQLCQ